LNDLELLANRLAIGDLFARYAHTADGYDEEGWLACFSEDGIFEVDAGEGGIQFEGQKSLREFIHAHVGLLPGTRHVMTNHLVEIDGNQARHRCTLTGMLSRPEKVYTFISGWYESTLEKVSGDWRIKHRIVHGDNSTNDAEPELVAYLNPLREWMAQNGTMVQH
jgi:3-phenylpropionate/cinnamic acid dioxygenase small subunit